MKKINWKALFLSILIPLGLGLLVGFLTLGSMDYMDLSKPPLSPPGWVFGVVWPILYILMGISCYLVYESDSWEKGKAFILYSVQLCINLLWSIFFFVCKWRFFSFIWILLLILFVIGMIYSFYKIRKSAGLLQIPYLLWTLFAAYLNIGIYLLN